MKLYLSFAAFYNRAPFEKLELYFEENEIAVLTAVNGRGKTTILSHIVDAFHEMAKPHFQNEYEGKLNKFYRLSSQIENLDRSIPSVVYIRFKNNLRDTFDYVNARGELTDEYYNSLELPSNKIQYHELKESIDLMGFVKKVSSNLDKKKIEAFFANNLLTYFPSYRYETPGYLNDPYRIELNFSKANRLSGLLNNPIEVVSGLPQLANWIMDVVLDITNNNDEKSHMLLDNLNRIVTKTIISKGYGHLRFGIGPRNLGSTRIQIVENRALGKTIYPSIFNISSGESSMLCLFGELIRQADKNINGITLNDVSGIVLVDEIDKHLHIKLQKEILPVLLNLFPNVQFIISSHSPFLNIGLAEIAKDRSKIIDLENFGISKDPTTNELYTEVYQLVVGDNDRFKDMYHALEEQLKSGSRPLVITEGKTDVQHLRAAKAKLKIQGCDFDFFEITEDWGDSKLKPMLDQLSKVPQSRKIIGIFDRDVPKIVEEMEKAGSFKDYGNNVFAFCIPIPNNRECYKNISIEFFYTDEDVKKEKDGKRLYFDNEVEYRQSAADGKNRTLISLNEPKSDDENIKKIFDKDIGNLDWIHSKSVFADLVENDQDFAKDFDFSNFQEIFKILTKILNT
ncbi:MAG: AAA family ATPase [Methylococcaceae bacterium]|nr:AAA family ATPase [Methylococcaceae bacterium]